MLPPLTGGLHCGNLDPKWISHLWLQVLPPLTGGLHCGSAPSGGRCTMRLLLPPFNGGLHCSQLIANTPFSSPGCAPVVQRRAPLPGLLPLPQPGQRRQGYRVQAPRSCKSVPVCSGGSLLSISATWPGRSSLRAGHPAISCTRSTTSRAAASTATRPDPLPRRMDPLTARRVVRPERHPAAVPQPAPHRGPPPGPRRPSHPPGPERCGTCGGRGLPGAGRPGARDAPGAAALKCPGRTLKTIYVAPGR